LFNADKPGATPAPRPPSNVCCPTNDIVMTVQKNGIALAELNKEPLLDTTDL
jgi:hypothetical protein